MSSQAGLALPVTLAELESHLWEAANILRGSPVDRTDWKSYILPLLFFKRICDVWDEEHAAMLAEYGEDFADEHRFQVPEGCHWSAVRRAPKSVGTALASAMRGVEAANQKHLYCVFGDAQWTNKDRLPDELLKDLIEHFSALSLGNARVASEVMGDAYEYLIKQFADATNKKAGEFYTPHSVVRLMVDILAPSRPVAASCGSPGTVNTPTGSAPWRTHRRPRTRSRGWREFSLTGTTGGSIDASASSSFVRRSVIAPARRSPSCPTWSRQLEPAPATEDGLRIDAPSARRCS
jgi:hypothetical protein